MRHSLLVFLIACCFAHLLNAQDAKLTVNLTSERLSYSLEGKLTLFVFRENAGTQALLLPRSLGWGPNRAVIRVIDSKGVEVRTDFIPDELPPPPRPEDFVRIDPGELFGVRLTEETRRFVNKPGDYEFVLDYVSFVPDAFVPAGTRSVRAWSSEDGRVISNRIKVHITK